MYIYIYIQNIYICIYKINMFPDIIINTTDKLTSHEGSIQFKRITSQPMGRFLLASQPIGRCSGG